MSELRATVHVYDDDGQSHIFGPGDKVPAWAAKKITNPAVWAEPAAETETADQMVPEGDPSDAWTVAQLKAYAAANGVGVGEATKKADILAAIAAAT